MASRVSPVLSDSQLATLAEHGEERTADVGETLFRVGDRRYPFIAIIEGEAAILDPGGNEIVRHGASGFLGEVTLLSGQTVFLTAVATQPMRYIAVDRDVLRTLLFDDGALADVLLSTFVERREALEQLHGIGIEVVGPRSSAETRRIVDFARRARLPHDWRDPEADGDPALAAEVARIAPEQLPLVRLPGGAELYRPTNGELSRALGIGLELEAREEVDLLVVGGGPAGLGAAVYGASEGLETLVIESTVLGGQAGTSRRIENYLGFPGGISGTELTGRAITQARKFQARLASPYRAIALEPGRTATSWGSKAATRSRRAASYWRPAPTTGGSPAMTSRATKASVCSTRRGRPRRSGAPEHGSVSWAAATRRARAPSGWRAAARS